VGLVGATSQGFIAPVDAGHFVAPQSDDLRRERRRRAAHMRMVSMNVLVDPALTACYRILQHRARRASEMGRSWCHRWHDLAQLARAQREAAHAHAVGSHG
jgi:hypothetical protein